MPLNQQLITVFKLCLATALAAVIGYEREKYSKPAGLRTHMILAIGCTILTVLSFDVFPVPTDNSRIAAAIITGIGFIGAGTVLQTRERIVGLTTAASIWLTASISLSVGTGNYVIAVAGTFLGYLVLESKPFQKKNVDKEREEVRVHLLE
ncbi:MAG: MgtC/SapB family protein [Candidatus Bathyarchaeota archaeon]|nr:MgtC/SapB family protein [Candidatus Bathyarchaeota archaeon]